MGINFSNPGLKIDDIRKVSKLLWERGVAAYCPTIITSPLETYTHNLPLIAAAAGEQGEGAKVLGVHLEGPFINPESGPRGIHQAAYIRPPSRDMYQRLSDLSRNTLTIFTIAPDQPGALDLIDHISSNSPVVVSLGHHLASHDLIENAVDAGAKAATHVGNGLPTLIHRHENPLWTILSDDRLYSFLITDGFHLPPPLIKVALKTKPSDKLILTSDLMHLGGLEPGPYRIGDLPIVLEKNGKLHREGSSQLAGAALPIDACSAYLHDSLHVSREEIHMMTRTNPLKLIQRSL